MRESVVLPAPDGEDRTSINPRRAMDSFGPGGREVAFLPAPFLAADFLLPAFVRPVFFWPALAAGVLAILDPRSALPGRHRVTKRYSKLGAIPDLALFQILHLLAKLLDHRLELKPDIGERHIV
jgi:hypothetical protein